MPAKRKTSTSKSGGKRRSYSPEEIAEFRRRDQEFLDKTTANLEDADHVRAYAERAARGGVSARVRNYSLRNQILLDVQATERGFVLTDVDTFVGWLARGYQVQRGQSGLRVVAPRRKDRPKDADPAGDGSGSTEAEPDDDRDDADDADDAGDGGTGEPKPPKRKFHTLTVFDVHQVARQETDPSAECPQCGAEPGEPCRPGCTCPGCVEDIDVPDAPAEELWNNLVEELTKAGYVLDWPARDADLSGARVRVDHDTRTVFAALAATADDPTAVADLAAAVAEITVRADRAAEARHAERATRALTAGPSTI